MALRFDAVADRLAMTTIPQANSNWEIHFWISFATLALSTTYTMFYVGTNAYASPYVYLALKVLGTGQTDVYLESNQTVGGLVSATRAAVGVVVDTWYSVVIMRRLFPSSKIQVFWDGLTSASPAVNSDNLGTFYALAEWGAGGGTSDDRPLDGRVAAIKWWTEDLELIGSPGARLQERVCYQAVERSTLRGEHPLIETTVADSLTDYAGQSPASPLVDAGTLTLEAGPPIQWRIARHRGLATAPTAPPFDPGPGPQRSLQRQRL